jgi:hypothetical protein
MRFHIELTPAFPALVGVAVLVIVLLAALHAHRRTRRADAEIRRLQDVHREKPQRVPC